MTSRAYEAGQDRAARVLESASDSSAPFGRLTQVSNAENHTADAVLRPVRNRP